MKTGLPRDDGIAVGSVCFVVAWLIVLIASTTSRQKELPMKSAVRIVASCLALLVASTACLAAPRHPNVIVILSDDQGWGDLSVHGNTNLATPNIDSLARDGAMFERFFVCPVCSPTRAEFLTGRYHPRGGVWSTSAGGERLNLDERTIADTFKAAGYATGAFGKWHNGTQWPYHPNARGFEEYYGFCSGHWGHYFDPVLEHNGQTVRGKGFIADDFTDHAIEFIEQHREQPFFCYLPYNTPHSPMQVPEKFYAKFRDAELKLRAADRREEDVELTRAALAMCENIDWNVGRVLAKLAELNLADDTIVVYFADNGPNGWRWNGEMKGRKASTDEGGVRSPLLVRWPGHIAAGTTVTQIAGAIDLLPTLTALADVKLGGDNLAAGKPLDGKSLAPLLLGKQVEWPDRLLFAHWSGKVSARSQQYRLDQHGKLFDPAADPAQEKDLSKEQPEKAAQMRAAMQEWQASVLGELKRNAADERPFSVGYREFPITQLPARDGVAQGNIARSARAPNCSYFTHWTSTNDTITWNIEVHTPGKYEAVVLYTCPAADVGSTVELEFAGHRAQAKVAEAFDPPLVGAEQDRVPRNGESLVKDFKPLSLGTFELPAGKGPLTLRATAIPGKSVMDVRGVTLTLVP
jgi:arylsulfatase A-like enzyme